MFNLCCDCLEGGVTRICPAFVCDVASLEASNVRAHTFSHTHSHSLLYSSYMHTRIIHTRIHHGQQSSTSNNIA
jgi:hypothetical protein